MSPSKTSSLPSELETACLFCKEKTDFCFSVRGALYLTCPRCVLDIQTGIYVQLGEDDSYIYQVILVIRDDYFIVIHSSTDDDTQEWARIVAEIEHEVKIFHEFAAELK